MAKRGTAEIRLGKLELKIMNVVWERGTATVHDVKDALSRGKTPAYTTVLTMMRNLEAKGYLEHEVDGRTFVYQPTLTRATARQSLLSELLERVFGAGTATSRASTSTGRSSSPTRSSTGTRACARTTSFRPRAR